jgi:transposase InsO family protein
VALRYTERLAGAGALASIGTVGDSYDNALAESIIGLYKTECVRLDGPFRTVDELELATLSWVHWYNSSGCTPPSATFPRPSTRRPTTVRTTTDSSRCRDN